jgi:hypothetical protein
MGKNINNDTWITPSRRLRLYYLCTCRYHIYFKRAFAFISTNISSAMLGMTTYNLSGVRSVNSRPGGVIRGKADWQLPMQQQKPSKLHTPYLSYFLINVLTFRGA